MDTVTSKYHVEYFTCSVTGYNGDKKVFDLIDSLITGTVSLQNKLAVHIGVRDVVRSKNGRLIAGVIAKYRTINLPHIGSMVTNNETKILLEQDEALLEKNFFIISRRWNLIVYQKNGNGCTPNQLAGYLTFLLHEAEESGEFSFHPVPDPAEIQDILARGASKKIEFTIAALNPKYVDQIAPDINGFTAKILHSTGGVHLRFSVTPARGEALNTRGVWDIIQTLFAGNTHIKTAKAEMLDLEGHYRHPINLLTKTVTDTITVEMEGKYPILNNIRLKLIEVYRAREELF
ncbi:MAG: hypothetical protein HQM03_06315 [Magnetococcales bacterium]|nr:hypothetical protein [Magnetococcales bacterium]